MSTADRIALVAAGPLLFILVYEWAQIAVLVAGML